MRDVDSEDMGLQILATTQRSVLAGKLPFLFHPTRYDPDAGLSPKLTAIKLSLIMNFNAFALITAAG